MQTQESDPINPVDVTKLTDDELDALIAQKRERRLRAFEVYQKAQQLAVERRGEQLTKQLEQSLSMFAKELDRVDKAIDKLDKRALKIRGIRLEMGEQP